MTATSQPQAPPTPTSHLIRSQPPVQVRHKDWRIRYARWLLWLDLIPLVVAFAAAEFWKFGIGSQATASGSGVTVPYAVAGLVLVGAWWVSLQIHRTRSPHVLGTGFNEYRRVLRASVMTFGALAIASVAFKVTMSREYIAVAFPLGVLGLLGLRKLARAALHRRWRQGKSRSRVLVVGTTESALATAVNFEREAASGYTVTDVWLVADEASEAPAGIRTHSWDTPAAQVLAAASPSTVLVTHPNVHGQEWLNRFAWDLAGSGVDLAISSAGLSITESRMHLRTVASMPLLHLEEPQYEGASRFTKRALDIVGATAVTILLSPLMLATALLVKITSPGPVFYRQERIGKDGKPFQMIKFRSMRQGADADLATLLEAEGASLAELPKLTDDPRITPVGKFIRRFSIDELPQLFNVFRGDMSLVGPRPQRDFEVAGYDAQAYRRLAVRPGMTGLWQVSGRSELSYDEAIRLDVYYVENWSLTADLVILWKTLRAVVASEGAY